MPHHHPAEDLLIDYATGGLGEGLSLVVATHLTYCPACRAAVRELEAIGGALLGPAAEGEAPALTAALPSERSAPRQALVASDVPQPLARYLGGPLAALDWRTTYFGLQEARVPVAARDAEATLMRIAPGRAMPRHTHDGLEATLVLAGGFSDHTGHYARGDVAIGDPSIDHRPLADPGAPCICLAVTVAPLRLTGPIGRALGYFRRR